METELKRPQDLAYWGLDRRFEDRPGVPREAAPHPLPRAHWVEPEQQIMTVPVLHRAGLARMTPVFGTAQPPRGLSGALRRIAYKIPDHRARHWVTLLLADRVDVIEGTLSRLRRRLSAAAASVMTAFAFLVGIRRHQMRK